MTARLSIVSADGSTSVYAPNFEADLQKYFARFMDNFDYTGGTETIRLAYTDRTDYALSAGPDSMVQVGVSGTRSVQENTPLQGILTGASSSGIINVSDSYIHNVYQPGAIWSWDMGRAATHELGHIYGNFISMYDHTTHALGPVENVYDTHVEFDSAGRAFFAGPSAEAVYGGRIPLDPSIDHTNFSLTDPTNVNHLGSVMNYNWDATANNSASAHGWTSLALTDVDIGIMRSNGVPILFQNEKDEHFWTRACDALFHHQVTASAIEAWAKILEGNGGDLVGTAGQFLGLLGIHTMTGGQLVDAANSDDERLKLAEDPAAYSHTMEQEITRIYQLATGQSIDPSDYSAALKAVLNGGPINAVTLQTKVAPIFLATDASRACFAGDATEMARVEHVMTNAGITNGWDTFPAAVKAALLIMPMADVVTAFADNNTCIQHQLTFSNSLAGPQPGMIPDWSLNLPHA